MNPPLWWYCQELGHAWCLESPMRCVFCGKHLLPLWKRVRLWWWSR